MNYLAKTLTLLVFITGLALMVRADAPLDVTDGDKKKTKVRSNRGIIQFTYTKLKSGIPGIRISKQDAVDIYEKPSVRKTVLLVIDDEGIEAGEKAYWHIKEHLSDIFEINVSDLNELGDHYLQDEEFEKAIAVLEMNAVSFPENYEVFHRLGEAYMKVGDREKAIINYTKSIELNPNNLGGIRILKKLVV